MDKGGNFNVADSWAHEKRSESSKNKSNNPEEILSVLAENYIKRSSSQKKLEDEHQAISAKLQQRLIKNIDYKHVPQSIFIIVISIN